MVAKELRDHALHSSANGNKRSKTHPYGDRVPSLRFGITEKTYRFFTKNLTIRYASTYLNGDSPVV